MHPILTCVCLLTTGVRTYVRTYSQRTSRLAKLAYPDSREPPLQCIVRREGRECDPANIAIFRYLCRTLRAGLGIDILHHLVTWGTQQFAETRWEEQFVVSLSALCPMWYISQVIDDSGMRRGREADPSKGQTWKRKLPIHKHMQSGQREFQTQGRCGLLLIISYSLRPIM